jgi:hypothetical protein
VADGEPDVCPLNTMKRLLDIYRYLLPMDVYLCMRTMSYTLGSFVADRNPD